MGENYSQPASRSARARREAVPSWNRPQRQPISCCQMIACILKYLCKISPMVLGSCGEWKTGQREWWLNRRLRGAVGGGACSPTRCQDFRSDHLAQLSLLQPSTRRPTIGSSARSFSCFHVFLLNSGLCSFSLAIMAQSSSLDVLLKGSSGQSTRGLLRIIILITIAAAAVASRLFSVIRKETTNCLTSNLLLLTSIPGFESIIHECMLPQPLLHGPEYNSAPTR